MWDLKVQQLGLFPRLTCTVVKLNDSDVVVRRIKTTPILFLECINRHMTFNGSIYNTILMRMTLSLPHLWQESTTRSYNPPVQHTFSKWAIWPARESPILLPDRFRLITVLLDRRAEQSCLKESPRLNAWRLSDNICTTTAWNFQHTQRSNS